MKCEKCGEEISLLLVNRFNRDGADSDCPVVITECEDSAIYIEVDQNWTGYELDSDEMQETISCPRCKQFPFASTEMQVYDIVRIVMFKEENHD